MTDYCKWSKECDVLCYDDPFGGITIQLLRHGGMDKISHFSMEPKEAVELLMHLRENEKLRFPDSVLETLNPQH